MPIKGNFICINFFNLPWGGGKSDIMTLVTNLDGFMNNKNNEIKHSLQINIKKISVVLILFCLLVSGKSFAFSLFKDKGVDKGKWVVPDTQMSKIRYYASANLLPDDNVLIMGGFDNLDIDTADIYNPQEQKIIKSINLDDKRFSSFKTTNLLNGDILIIGGELYNSHSIIGKRTNTAKLFDSKNYTFNDIKPAKYDFSDHLQILLKNGHVLLLPFINMIKEEAHEIYNPYKNIYYKASGKIPHEVKNDFYFEYENGNIIVFSRGIAYLYDIIENSFKEIGKIPKGNINIQLNSESYLCIDAKETYSEGFIYNIVTKKQIPVQNKIMETWNIFSAFYPQLVLLDNGNVLVFGIGKSKFNTYLYEKNINKFYKIPNPPIIMQPDIGIVKLKNGDILFAGGTSYSKKIQIYTYKHKEKDSKQVGS